MCVLFCTKVTIFSQGRRARKYAIEKTTLVHYLTQLLIGCVKLCANRTHARQAYQICHVRQNALGLILERSGSP